MDFDALKKLLIRGLLAAVIGGFVAWILSMFINPIMATTWGGIIGAGLALVALFVVFAKTTIDNLDIASVLILWLAVAFVGGILAGIVPAIAPFILVPTQAFTPVGLGWTYVYIGIAMLITKKWWN